MNDTYVFGGSFPLNDTICKDCIFRMSVLITPLNPESLGIDIDELEDKEGPILVEQHTCLIAQQDMDYIVHNCNHFKSINEISIFKNNPFQNDNT